MADIFHQLTVRAAAEEVFRAVSTHEGLDAWWTLRSSGRPETGAEYRLWFGPEYDWHAIVSRCVPGQEFELEIVDADEDWRGTRVGFLLDENHGVTRVRFHHSGWPAPNEHYRVSSFCWALYLRLLERYVERGEVVPYGDRAQA